MIGLSLWLASPAFADRAVGILPFQSGNENPAYDGLGTALAGMVTSDLVLVPGVVVVERERLGDLLAELKLAETGFLDPQTVQRVGKGIGAELWLQGKYAIVGDQFFLDLQLLSVETGGVVTAVDQHGPTSDWVSVEKRAMEELVDGLQVDLAVAVRRKLVEQKPTDDLEALASYGRGVEAADDERWDEARLAYEAALREDPDFALAGRELASLQITVSQGLAREQASSSDARTRALTAALAQLPSEIDRPATFRDTRASEIDLAIRWAVLQRLGRSCELMEEMRHYFVRRKGAWTPWINDLKGSTPYDRSRVASELFDTRGRQLGLVGPNTPFTERPGELFYAGAELLREPIGLLIASNLRPEKFNTWSGQFDRCIPLAAQEAKWQEVIALADHFGLTDQPAWRESTGPAPITVGVVVRMHRAFLRARAFGGDAEVVRMTEAELARYPEGAPGRFELLSRANEVVEAGRAFERQAAHRLGLSDGVLIGAVRALAEQRPERIRTDVPLCLALAQQLAPRATSLVQKIDTGSASEADLNQAGMLVAPMQIAGCFQGQTPRTFDEIVDYVESSLLRPHPSSLDKPECRSQREQLQKQVETTLRGSAATWTPEMQAPTLYGVLVTLHLQRGVLCLVP